MKLALGLIALANAGTWKRSSDEPAWEESTDLKCYNANFMRYAQLSGDVGGYLNLVRFANGEEFDDPIFEDVVVNGTHVCVMSMEDEEFNLANGIGPCDCSDPENFDFEDEGRFFDTEG